MHLDRRQFLGTLGTAAAAAACSRHPLRSRRSRRQPNIVFIIADDMGYADLGCYGSQHIQTPNIDRMATEGIRFTDAYSGCTVCAPARSCLMTGLHMGHTSVRGNTGGISLRDEDVTVAEVLRQTSYACGGFGKWGLGDVETPGVPEKQGFDVFFGYYHQVHAHDYYPPYLWCSGEKVPLPGNADKKKQQYTHYRIFERMKEFLRANKEQPFFCYAPWTPPHADYVIPDDDPAWQMYKDKPWPHDAKVVAAMDSMIDRHVGEILALLEELDIDDRTIVFFCSDNGAAKRFDGLLDSSGPLRGYKRSLYEGGIRVPMIVRWPGTIKAGGISDHPWYFPDVMPTLAELASGEPPTDIDGISVVPTLLGDNAAGRRQEQHDFLYWEYHRYNWQKGQNEPNGMMQAVRMGTWKAVRPKNEAPLELYDLTKDIREENDVASQHPGIVEKIGQYLKTCRTDPRPQIEPDKPKGQRYR